MSAERGECLTEHPSKVIQRRGRQPATWRDLPGNIPGFPSQVGEADDSSAVSRAECRWPDDPVPVPVPVPVPGPRRYPPAAIRRYRATASGANTMMIPTVHANAPHT
jgi:hypothetical protein